MIVDKSYTYLASDTPSYGTSETNPAYGGATPSISFPTYEIPSTNTPLLVTPEIEPFKPPVKGAGASIVAEPLIGTPIVKNDTPSPVGGTSVSLGNGTGNGTTTGGGATTGTGTGATTGGGATTGTGNGTPSTITPKKKNYVLYGGILLAVIIAYKVLFSKKEN